MNRSTILPQFMDAYIQEWQGKDRPPDAVASPEERFGHNIPFAISATMRFRHYDVPLDDMLQEAMAGMWEAANRYQGGHGASFITYASLWIRAYINRYLATMAQECRIAHSAWTDMLMGRQNGPAVDARIARMDPLFLDAPLPGGRDDDRSAYDVLPSEVDDEDWSELTPMFTYVLDQFDDRTAYVVASYYGLGAKEKNFTELGYELGLSRERVRQIRQEFLCSIRDNVDGRFDRLWEYAQALWGDDVDPPKEILRWRRGNNLIPFPGVTL